ncbi:MAG: hypothetical protein AABZ11_08795 [Nitrospinota bacterium]
MGLEYEELTVKIVGAAIEVHKRLGPGFMSIVNGTPIKRPIFQKQRNVIVLFLIQFSWINLS